MGKRDRKDQVEAMTEEGAAMEALGHEPAVAVAPAISDDKPLSVSPYRRFRDAKDPYGYAAYRRRRAIWLPTGVALIFLGCALSSAASTLPPSHTADGRVVAEALDRVVSLATKDIVTTSFSGTHAIATLLLIVFVAAGVLLIRAVQDEDHAFKRAHPHLSHGATTDELIAAQGIRRRFVIAGGVCIGAAVVVNVLLAGSVNDARVLAHDLDTNAMLSRTMAFTMALVFLLLAIGSWLVVHGLVVGASPAIRVYNYRALQSVSAYEIDVSQTGTLRDVMLAEKRVQERHALATRAMVVLGVSASLAMYFLPTLETPFYWLGIVVAAVGCLLLDNYALNRAERERIRAAGDAKDVEEDLDEEDAEELEER